MMGVGLLRIVAAGSTPEHFMKHSVAPEAREVNVRTKGPFGVQRALAHKGATHGGSENHHGVREEKRGQTA